MLLNVMSDIEYTLHQGEVQRCYQLASGTGIYNPFGASTLELQIPKWRERGFDLGEHVPGYFLGTLNVNIAPKQLRLKNADVTLRDVEWTDQTIPEHFSFVRCSLVYKGYYFSGVIYYPHPETKPRTNAHFFDRLEIITMPIPGIKMGEKMSVLCRSDAFEEFS